MSEGQSSDKMMRPLHNEPEDSSDEEIEFIKLKKLIELRKAMLKRKAQISRTEEDPEKVVRENLTERAIEVLEVAKQQYPKITKRIIVALAKAIKAGEVVTPISATTLLNTFRYLGIPVRLETRIRFYKKGRYMDLREKLKEGI